MILFNTCMNMGWWGLLLWFVLVFVCFFMLGLLILGPLLWRLGLRWPGGTTHSDNPRSAWWS